MGIYMNYGGIEGEATQQDHKKWIDVLSLSWGSGRGISTVYDGADNREASEPSVSEVSIVKEFDAASPQLVTEASTGYEGKTVKIDLTTTGSPSDVFCTYTLSNALIDSYSVTSSGERPTESVSISFTKLEFKFTPYDDKNMAGTPTTVSYDIATTKASSVPQYSASDLTVAYDVSAQDSSPVFERAGDDITVSYDWTTRTGTFQSGTLDLTSRFGSSDDDVIRGSEKRDILNGLDGHDVLRGGAADDAINGGAGIDTAVFAGTLAQHVITAGGNRAKLTITTDSYGADELNNAIDLSQFNVGSGALRTVTDQVAGRNGTDTLSQVERLKFTDVNLAFDTAQGENAGEVYRLYTAAFGRTPDQDGLGYWLDRVDHGMGLEAVASAFIASPEFVATYGANLSDSNFIHLLYEHALNRAPDAAGAAYWMNALSQGMTRGAVLASFSESAEGVAQSAPLVANGIQYQEWTG
ncbi:type VI secretion system tube protein Hcp [Flavobacterium sp.]|jgi:type VI secretion system secreted protein Hcp|uniref:type VI secretion system tube protein Hcp n=1 Tax=Flavobacterium sp. TaxID=239 RepID=UPI0037C0C026